MPSLTPHMQFDFCLLAQTATTSAVYDLLVFTYESEEKSTEAEFIQSRLTFFIHHAHHEWSYLGRLHGCVGGPWWDLVALCVQFKVVDQRLHGHLGPRAQLHKLH